jgi:hypothetical protein
VVFSADSTTRSRPRTTGDVHDPPCSVRERLESSTKKRQSGVDAGEGNSLEQMTSLAGNVVARSRIRGSGRIVADSEVTQHLYQEQQHNFRVPRLQGLSPFRATGQGVNHRGLALERASAICGTNDFREYTSRPNILGLLQAEVLHQPLGEKLLTNAGGHPHATNHYLPGF